MAEQLSQAVADAPQPWWVVGQGAIGLLAASRWTLAGQPVRLWLKSPHSNSLELYLQRVGLRHSAATALQSARTAAPRLTAI